MANCNNTDITNKAPSWWVDLSDLSNRWSALLQSLNRSAVIDINTDDYDQAGQYMQLASPHMQLYSLSPEQIPHRWERSNYGGSPRWEVDNVAMSAYSVFECDQYGRCGDKVLVFATNEELAKLAAMYYAKHTWSLAPGRALYDRMVIAPLAPLDKWATLLPDNHVAAKGDGFLIPNRSGLNKIGIPLDGGIGG